MLYFNEDLKDFVFLGDNIPNGIEFCLKQNDDVEMGEVVEKVLSNEPQDIPIEIVYETK